MSTTSSSTHPSSPARLCRRIAAGAGLWLSAAGLADPRIPAGQPAAVDLRTAALILSGQDGGTIPMAVLAIPRPAAEARATVVVEVDGPGLADEVFRGEAPDGETPLDVYLYSLDRDGVEVFDQVARRLTLDWSRYRELSATGLKLSASLRVPAAESRVRVLVRHGGSLGLRSARVAPPEVEGTGPRIVALSFPDAREWVVAALTPGPDAAAGEAALPASLPALTAATTAEARLLVRDPPPDPWSLRGLWSTEDADQVVERHELLAVESSPSAGAGEDRSYRTVTVVFDVPELPPGRYRLSAQMRWVTGGSQVVTTDSEPLTVFVGGPPAARVAAAPPPPDVSTEELPRKAAREIERRYLEALDLLAAGDREGALAVLRAFETSAFESLAELAPAALEGAESRAFLGLPDEVWLAALPVLLLHADAARDYARSRRRDLREHALRMTVALADAYVRRLDDAEARHEACATLTVLAGDLLGRGALTRAEALLTHATELDGGDPNALLSLAAIHEKNGRAEAASALFERLVDVQPGHPEGRLRLALNRRRTGETEAARRILRSLLDQEPAWVALLAHQELARAAIDDGDPDEALRWVRRGLRRWPGHPSLTLQHAYLLDVTGRRQAAAELLAEVGADGGRAVAERTRYNRWPLAAIAAADDELAERARGRLAELARILRSRP